MSFSEYKTIAQVQLEYNIKYEEFNFIDIKNYQVSPIFIDEFNFNQENMDLYSSEAARCEIIIFPILREVYKSYYQKTAFWVQKSIFYNNKLSGTPDYMISQKSPLGKTMLEFPLLIIVEAKKNDFEQGWAQCLAELIAAQNLNNQPTFPLYGIVTDGKLWEFAKLIEQNFVKNTASFTVSELTRLFGALTFVFDQVTQFN